MKTLSIENQKHRELQASAKASSKWRMFWLSSKLGTYYRGDEHRTKGERARNRLIAREMRRATQ